jgi:hypothetical protein
MAKVKGIVHEYEFDAQGRHGMTLKHAANAKTGGNSGRRSLCGTVCIELYV